MPFLPVAAREARSASRSPKTYGWRTAIAAIGLITIPVALWFSRSSNTQGHDVFISISTVAYFYCLFAGVLRTADSIAEEKRENTLGLLFLTDLKPIDVLAGKLFASSATIFFGLLAFLPLLAVPVLIGGVRSAELAQVALALINTLFFSISIGFLVSIFCRQGWIALFLALGAAFFIGVAYPFFFPSVRVLPAGGMDNYAKFGLTPADAFGAAVSNVPWHFFLRGLVPSQIISWLFLLLCIYLLPRHWQERPRSRRGEKWFRRLSRLRFGSAKTRAKFRARLLNRNPLFWLSGREQVSSGGLMGFMLFIAMISALGRWSEIIFGLVALHLILLVRMASAASHSLAEDRKSGALELLLATELSVKEVLRGRWMALGRQFFGPILIVSVWHIFTIAWMGIEYWRDTTYQVVGTAWPALALAWIATGWFGMWLGLRTRQPLAATWGVLAIVVLLPWIAMGGIVSMLAAFDLLPNFANPVFFTTRAPQPLIYTLVHIGWYVWGGYCALLIAWTARRVRNSFRESATDRFTERPLHALPTRRIMIGSIATVVIIVSAFIASREWIQYSGERAWRKALAGYPNFSPKKPLHPMPPSRDNLAEWPPFRGRQLFGNQQIQINGGGWRHAQPANYTHRLRKNGSQADPPLKEILSPAEFKMLDELRAAAAERPFLQFPNDAIGLYGASYSYFVAQDVNLLAMVASKRIEAGENPIDDVLLALRFANCVSHDGSALTLHQGLLSNAIQPIYDGFRRSLWSDEDLAKIENAFAGLDPFKEFELWRDHIARIIIEGDLSMAGMRVPPPSLMNRLHGNNLKENAAILTDIMRESSVVFNRAEKRIYPNNRSSPAPPSALWRRYVPFVGTPDFHNALRGGTVQSVGAMQTEIDQVRLACAIERFRHERHRLPQKLDELKTNFPLPHDVFTGNPLIYRVDPDGRGYILYGVGVNGIDDNGQFGDVFQQTGDLVWKMRF